MRADQAAKPLDAFIDHLVIGAGIAKAQRIRTGSVGKERLARNECHLSLSMEAASSEAPSMPSGSVTQTNIPPSGFVQ